MGGDFTRPHHSKIDSSSIRVIRLTAFYIEQMTPHGTALRRHEMTGFSQCHSSARLRHDSNARVRLERIDIAGCGNEIAHPQRWPPGLGGQH